MVIDNAVLLIAATAMTLIALVVCVFIGIEVVGIVRDVFTRLPDRSRRPSGGAVARAPGDTGPLGAPPPERRPTPDGDREAVNKLIDHLEDDDETPTG